MQTSTWKPLVATLSAFAVLSVSGGAEYHVAAGIPGAAADGPGTPEKPFRTIARATQVAQAGDTVLIHAGRYPESLVVGNPGAPGKPIVIKAFGDDDVVLDGADEVTPDTWQPVPGARTIFAVPADADPGRILVDGKPVYPKVVQTKKDYMREYALGTLTDDDRNLYQFDAAKKALLINLGDEPARHTIRLPVRQHALILNAYCRLAGVRALNYLSTAIVTRGDDAVVEDCVVTDCGAGIVIPDWNRRGVILRRNTVIGTIASGLHLQDRPTGCLVEDNLAVRCSLNPAHLNGWDGSIKMNSAADTVFAHNVVLEAGNPNTDGGHDGWALWGDINVVRVFYVGNTCANNKEAGIYVEYAMGDTRAYYNTSYRNGHGITCRQSQRGVFMRNLILESRSSGLAVWGGGPPYATTDNVFAHNLVKGCNPAIWLQIEHPNFSDYNTFWPRQDAPLAAGQAPNGGATPSYKDLPAWNQATGHDLHSEVRDARPEDVGLDTVTFRVPDAKDPTETLMMVGNGGFELEDPAGQNIMPYFWRLGTGDGKEHVFVYAAYCGLAGGVSALSFPGCGATIAHPADSPDPQDPRLTHSGIRCLEIDAQKPDAICADGVGVWTPSLPARPGDTYDIDVHLRGKDLKPAAGATAMTCFVEFTSSTGQQRRRVDIGGTVSGTTDWTRAHAEARVPDAARRMRVFLGVLPAQGTLLLDDISIKVR
jgi:hypothetical protein